MNKAVSYIGVFTMLATGLGLVQPAAASNVSVTGDLNWTGKITDGLYISLNGTDKKVRAGEPSLTVTSVTGTTPPAGLSSVPLPGDFSDYMWCIEPNQGSGNGTHTWNLLALEDAPVPGASMQKADDLRLLFGNVYPGNPIDGIPTSGNIGGVDHMVFRDAFQLAIWEITKETAQVASGSPDYSFGSGTFSVQTGYNATAVDLADDWLLALNNLNAGVASAFDINKRANNLYALSWNGEQDYVVAVNPVPLPAAAWLFLSAVIGTGLLGRRRSAKSSD